MSGERRTGTSANGAAGGSTCSIDWNFQVIARHADGACRLVFSESRTQERDSASGGRTAETIDTDGFFDIRDDGRLVENWTITPMANPTMIFPRLPADRSQIAAGWHSTLQLDGAHRQYEPASADLARGQSSWQFVEDCRTQLDPIYHVSRQRHYAFDVQQGLVTQVSTSLQRGWPAQSGAAVSIDSIHLIDVATRGRVDSARVHQEADRYFASCAEYQRLVDLALWDLPQSSRWLEQAAQVLEQFEATVRVEFIREMLRRKLRLHHRERGSMLSDAERLAALIDKPALDWQTVDLEGNLHALKDYEGKVLVLCFWNRGCTWSLRALLALNALASGLHARPIAFLGVNADRNVADAAFVWQTFKMVFPTIVDGPGAHCISGSYGVDGYPTTVVIDPSGIIRRMRAGYSYQLSSTLAHELTGLVSGAVCQP
jgi:peroxiredoxin